MKEGGKKEDDERQTTKDGKTTNLTSPFPSTILPYPPTPNPLHPSLPRVHALLSPALRFCLLHPLSGCAEAEACDEEEVAEEEEAPMVVAINVGESGGIEPDDK
jgi:hypothetical protein